MDIIVDIEIHFNTTPYSFTNSLSSKQSTLSDSSPRQEQKEQQQPEQQHLELQREQLEQQQQEKLLEIIDQFILSLTKDYIWHKHHLKFQCRRKNSTPKQTKNMNLPASKQNIITLSSSTNIGQCVDDESFILYLLIQLSIKFDNTVISIKDNDGQFMLIDAADHIPSWINPESIENRVRILNLYSCY